VKELGASLLLATIIISVGIVVAERKSVCIGMFLIILGFVVPLTTMSCVCQ